MERILTCSRYLAADKQNSMMLRKLVFRDSMEYVLLHSHNLPVLPDEFKEVKSYELSFSELEEELEKRLEVLMKIGKYRFDVIIYPHADSFRVYVGDRYYLYLGGRLAEKFWMEHKDTKLETILQAAKEILLIDAVSTLANKAVNYHHLYKKAKDPEELVKLLREYRRRLMIELL